MSEVSKNNETVFTDMYVPGLLLAGNLRKEVASLTEGVRATPYNPGLELKHMRDDGKGDALAWPMKGAKIYAFGETAR